MRGRNGDDYAWALFFSTIHADKGILWLAFLAVVGWATLFHTTPSCAVHWCSYWYGLYFLGAFYGVGVAWHDPNVRHAFCNKTHLPTAMMTLMFCANLLLDDGGLIVMLLFRFLPSVLVGICACSSLCALFAYTPDLSHR
jgi:hypothetical protein